MGVAKSDTGSLEHTVHCRVVTSDLLADRRRGQTGGVQLDGAGDLLVGQRPTTHDHPGCLQPACDGPTVDPKLGFKLVDGCTSTVLLNKVCHLVLIEPNVALPWLRSLALGMRLRQVQSAVRLKCLEQG